MSKIIKTIKSWYTKDDNGRVKQAGPDRVWHNVVKTVIIVRLICVIVALIHRRD